LTPSDKARINAAVVILYMPDKVRI
jgi:hypothetical protein